MAVQAVQEIRLCDWKAMGRKMENNWNQLESDWKASGMQLKPVVMRLNNNWNLVVKQLEWNYKAIRMGEQLESKWNAIGKHKKKIFGKRWECVWNGMQWEWNWKQLKPIWMQLIRNCNAIGMQLERKGMQLECGYKSIWNTIGK